ncbi:GNAT family N-acetyltransferase [Clostridium saccharoperbutylacetonicum]
MELIRTTENWQRAAAYNVRIEAMVKGFGIRLDQEIDDHDTENTKYIVAFNGRYPIGTCRLNWIDEKTGKIERVCVLEDYRKTGVGKQIILEAEAWIKEQGGNKIIISSRIEAIGFYERLGYKVDWSTREVNGVFECVNTEKIF